MCQVYSFYIFFFFSVELKKLQEEGFGKYVDRNDMQKDKVLPSNSCLSVFVKRDVLDLPEKFFSMAMNPEFTPELYTTNYDRQMDSTMKRISAY